MARGWYIVLILAEVGVTVSAAEAQPIPEPQPQPEPEVGSELRPEGEQRSEPQPEARGEPAPTTTTAREATATPPASAAPDLSGQARPGWPPGDRTRSPVPRETDGEGSYGAVAVVPAPGGVVPLRGTPRNVQLLGRGELRDSHPTGLHDALNARLGSVVVNHVQSNPLQPDLQYRGFTASPLLGTPQGLAVYQNGVRVNEPFGDVVQWDLIPEFAIHEAQLVPGANPLFGLNALGGSLVLQMKDGFSASGHRVTVLGGSFSRHRVIAEAGHVFNDWAVYAGVSSFAEEGFRDVSPSSALQGFADLRHRTPTRNVGVNVTAAATHLTGNGPAPIELLERRRAAVFTFPDETRNDLVLVAGNVDEQLYDSLSVQATAYLRRAGHDTLNGDEADLAVCTQDTQSVLCDEDGEIVRTETGDLVTTSDPFDGVLNTTDTTSDGHGGSVQVSLDEAFSGRANQLVVGTSYDGSQVGFLQRVEGGRLTSERSVLGENVFLAGDEFRTRLEADTRAVGIYFMDSHTLIEPLVLGVGARGNWVNVELADRQGSALDGDHTFSRVNPTVGLTYTPVEALTLFASYSEANRAPSAAELACADPDAPCRLPNAFVSDPPLDQVINRAIEVGARGKVGNAARPTFSWSLAAFGSRNFDDIIFVGASRVGTGYFRNAGETQRVGLEAALSIDTRRVSAYAGTLLLRATFEDALVLPGGAHPGATRGDADGGGVIEVEPGDRVPGLPTHVLKAGVAVRPTTRWEIGLSSIGQSAQVFRGDEANILDDVDGYVVFAARTSYDLLDELQLFAKAENLLDEKYSTFGVLADPSGALPLASDPRFLSPGPPFGVWAGVVLHSP